MQEGNLKRENTEIRDQVHLMDAEGACDIEPTEIEVKDYVKQLGYYAYNIDIGYDTMQGFWRWTCDIKKALINIKNTLI